jgi:hypothetical protein
MANSLTAKPIQTNKFYGNWFGAYTDDNTQLKCALVNNATRMIQNPIVGDVNGDFQKRGQTMSINAAPYVLHMAGVCTDNILIED